MKKVLLVHPEISRNKYNFAGVIDNEPLELEYIAALLHETGYDTDLWDGQVETRAFAEKLAQYRPDCVYVCGRTRQEAFMKEYCQAAKAQGCLTIVGGIHAQKSFARFYTDFIDRILITFDIFQLPALLAQADPARMDGVCYPQNGEWIYNAPKPFDIGRLPRPDRTYFYAHMDRYRYLELLPCAHVRTAYSCPFRCTFCYRNQLNCGVYSARDIEDVVRELQEIECENIYFVDDDFLIDKSRIEAFIHLVREAGIRKKYVCYGRADFIAANPELMRELKDIGFYYILTGLESVRDSSLDRYQKKTNTSINANAVAILNRVGIHMMGMWITDLDFTARDFREIYRWIKTHKLRHAAISIFTPELSSEQFEEYRDRLVTQNPADWDYLHVVAKPDHMSVRRYYFHYHILLGKLFVKGWRDGIYDFIDYGFYLKSIIKNLFRFGG